MGYLSYRPRKDLRNTVDDVFVRQQASVMSTIALGMVAKGALMALAMAAWLARPIRRLQKNTHCRQ